MRAARAMLLEANDLSTRISTARRQLFAERTFARSSSVLDPQLWAAVGRELPVDAGVVRNLLDNWVGAIGERPLLAKKIGMAAIVIVLALAAAPLGWIARRFVYRDLGRDERQTDCAARLPRPGHSRSSPFCRSPASGCSPARSIPSILTDPSMQGVIDAAFEAARVLIAINALSRGIARPAARGLEARSAQRSVGQNPLSPRDDVCRDLGRRAAGRACGRRVRLASISRSPRGASAPLPPRSRSPTALRQLGAQPAGAQGSPQSEAWAPLRTLGWAAALIIFLAP